MKNKSKRLQVQKLKGWDYGLIAMISLSILIVMLVFSVFTSNAKQSQINLVKDVMEKLSENQKEQFEDFIDEKINTLKTLVSYPEIYEMNESEQKKFIKGRSSKWGFSQLFVMDMEGNGYYVEEGVHRKQAGEAFFYNIKNNKIYVTEPFYTGEGVAIVTMCVSIYDEAGEKVGILCGTVDLNNVQEIIGKNEMILEGKSYILSDSGRYVTSQNASDVYNKIPIYNTPNSELSLIEEAFNTQSDKSGTIILNGIEYQTHITYLDDYKWAIVQNIPVSKITERYAYLNVIQYVLLFFIVILICCIMRIIFSWKKSDKKIYTDVLTGCNSRAACLDLLDYLEDYKKQQITIIYMDLNNFKWVNDTYGHDKGDELLKRFSNVLTKTLGKEGFVGRMGGDEFIAVMLDVTEEDFSQLWCQVETALAEESKKLDFPYQITSSYGYASREKGESESLNMVLQLADKSMYENKTAQKEKVK